MDFKEDLYKLSRVLKTQLLKTNTEVRYNTKVTQELIEEIKPDVAIVATGAVPIIPPIPGINGNNVYLASEVEEKGADQLGDEIVILGGGLVGCETAIHLGKLGKKVTVVEMRSEAAADCNCFHKIAIGMELKKYVTVLTDTKAENITDKGLEGLDKDGNKIFVPADAVICAAGMRSDTTVADMVQKMEIEMYVIGDAVRPNKVTQAIFDGYYIAKYL